MLYPCSQSIKQMKLCVHEHLELMTATRANQELKVHVPPPWGGGGGGQVGDLKGLS